jgi:hypothetical protein
VPGRSRQDFAVEKVALASEPRQLRRTRAQQQRDAGARSGDAEDCHIVDRSIATIYPGQPPGVAYGIAMRSSIVRWRAKVKVKKNDGPIEAATGARGAPPCLAPGTGGCWSGVKRHEVASPPGREYAPHLGVFTRAERRNPRDGSLRRPPLMQRAYCRNIARDDLRELSIAASLSDGHSWCTLAQYVIKNKWGQLTAIPKVRETRTLRLDSSYFANYKGNDVDRRCSAACG